MPRAVVPANIADDMIRLTTDQVRQWRDEGYCVLDGVDIAAARSEAAFESNKGAFDDFGSANGTWEFPTGKPNLDRLVIRFQNAARQLLGCHYAYISQADVWIKKPKARTAQANDDQRIHCDFGNNIIIPSTWDNPTALSIIVYFDGPEECEGGGTAVVPKQGLTDGAFHREKMVVQPGYGGRPFINNREHAEAWFEANRPEEAAFRRSLYAREKIVMPRIGRVLLYRLDVWHRGTSLLKGSRRVMNMVWFSKAATGTAGRWNLGFWRRSYDVNPQGVYSAPDKLFEALSPDERVALGLPAVDDSFWTEKSLALVKLRFPGFDPTPYQDSVARRLPEEMPLRSARRSKI